MRHPLFVLLMLCAAATGAAEPEAMRPVGPLWLGPDDSSAPHLALTPDGRPVMSWLETSGRQATLRFAVYTDGRWGPAATVASGPDWFVNWADFPSVVPLTEELWAAHWLRRTAARSYAYDVVLSLSKDGGASWGRPFVPHDDGTPTEHGFVSLYPDGGSAGLLWLDGREMLPDGHDAAMTLRAARFDPAGQKQTEVVLDSRVCDCCQTDVAISSDGPVAVYRDRSADEIRDIAVSRLRDGRWSAPVPVAEDGWTIAGCPVNGPAIAAGSHAVVVAWFTAAADEPRVLTAFSADAARNFSAPVTVDAAAPIGRVGAVVLGEDRAIVSWLAEIGDGRAELRAARFGPRGRQSANRVIAVTEAARLSGFPQIVRVGDDLMFAWTRVEEGRLRVASRLVQLSVF